MADKVRFEIRVLRWRPAYTVRGHVDFMRVRIELLVGIIRIRIIIFLLHYKIYYILHNFYLFQIYFLYKLYKIIRSKDR